LLYPLRRRGAKGGDQFERISWDAALDEITARWTAIIAEHGPQAIAPYSYLGHQGLLHGLNGGDAFFNRMGATVMERTFCGEGSATAWLMTYGPSGGQTIRAVCCLPALTGAWREVGGGILQMPVWEHPYRLDLISRPDWIPAGTRAINNLKIGRYLTGAIPLDPPIQSMMCWNSNPVTQAPETDKIIEGLMRDDLFLVVADHFVTDVARYADIVLPAAMGAEMEDIILSWGHNYLTYNERCVEAPGEALSNREIFRRLAARMGYEDEDLHWSDSECLEHFIDWASPACEGIDLEHLRAHGYAHLAIGGADDRAPHREGNFPTPSGKCEFVSGIAAHGNFVAGPFRQMYEHMQGGEPLDALPDYVPPRETPHTNPELAKKYPLNIVSPKSHGFLNSCYANMAHKIRGQGDQFVLINPADAASRRIGAGDAVRVFNDRGAFEGEATITDDVNAGLVVATLGYWRQLNRGTVNAVSSAEFVDMGHAPSFSDNLVEVEPVA
jgi:anaerobic selenocysteine-containing dehydrogenase